MKANLLEILKSTEVLTSGVLVGSLLVKELEIYGFIPYIESSDLDNNLTLPLDMRLGIIASDRFSYSVEEYSSILGGIQKKEQIILPIYRKLQCDNAEHRLKLKNLYVFSLRTNSYYKDFRNRKQVNLQQLKRASSQISILDPQEVYYETKSNEILMYKKASFPIDKVSAVASYFLVVCRFINSVTGGISYAIYPPEDLFLLIK